MLRKLFSTFGLVASLFSGPLMASELAVSSSIRPADRPIAQPVAATITPIQIRPLARPKGAKLVEIQISTSNPGFQQWVKGFRKRALAKGISATVFDRSFRGVRYDKDIIVKDRNQAEFKKTIWEYLDLVASPSRIKNGNKALRKHKRILAKIEARYGVEKEVVTAVWGLESAYGKRRGDTDVIEALATLSYDGRRGKFFESQLIAALKILQSGDVSPRKMKGSWAGAMGHTQFIPTSYLAYAQDFTGDGKRDIWSDDPTDALASTAAYLARFGWRKGQPWGVEVSLPPAFNYGLASRKIRKNPSDWAAMGVRAATGGKVPNHGKASILLPAGVKGAAFMIFSNFAVIEKYNRADAYVIGVGHLSDRLAGGGPITSRWPRDYKPLSKPEMIEMQQLLTRKGFDTGGADGLIGPNTVKAIRAFQLSVKTNPDGFASKKVLKLLRRN